MPKKEHLFFSAIILVGLIDWLTTIAGVLFFGATEINPLLSGLTKTSMVLFSAIKLSAIVIAGFAFYKARALSTTAAHDWHFTRKFLYGGYSVALLALTAVVANNLVAITGI
jgi:hypothetical protein